jgi:hypothetical protein
MVALVAGMLPASCESGSSTCFSPVHGPASPSCDAFDANLVCPVDLTPWYTCTCTPTDAGKSWVCTPAGSTASGSGGMGSGGAPGTGGGAGGGGDAGME